MVPVPATVVTAGLNDPQAAEPQVTVQITPPLVGSFVTEAANPSVVLIAIELAPILENSTAIGLDSTVRLTLLLCEGLLVTVAVMVTVVPIGTTDGAVNTLAAVSAVCAGVSVPQAPLVMLPVVGLPPQVTVQSTPALATSLDGIMLNDIFEPMESAVAEAVSPFALVIVIGVALTPEVEAPPPQPAIRPASKVIPAQIHKRVAPTLLSLCCVRL
jgi:hypothetical protein